MRHRLLTSLAATFLAGLALSPANALDSKPKGIPDAERAAASFAVANVMGRHAFYHGAGKNCEELENIWAKHPPTPDTFTNPMGAWTGEHIHSSYCEMNLVNEKNDLEELRKKYPEIPDTAASLGAGDFLFHFLTTPIIEIAGDGKTAKGMWYSPGVYIGATKGTDGKAGGIYFYEKYGVDFIKEDDQWKIWHIQMYYDFTGPLEHGVADVPVGSGGPKEAGETKSVDPRMKQDKANPNPYPGWSPTRVPIMIATPAPYYTFSETFAY